MNFVAIVSFVLIFGYVWLASDTNYECEFHRIVDADGQPKVFIVDHVTLYHGRDSQIIVSDGPSIYDRRFAFPREQLKTCKREKKDG